MVGTSIFTATTILVTSSARTAPDNGYRGGILGDMNRTHLSRLRGSHPFCVRGVLTLAWACVSTLLACGPVAAAVPAPVGAQDPATESSAARFDVWEFRVLGNSVLPVIDVERTMYPFLGAQRTLVDVEAARTALEKQFHDSGYGTVFVDVPEQDVVGGVVRLKVTEGQIRTVRTTGARYFSGREIRSALPTATPGEIPHLPTLQQEISELNRETPDRTVVPALRAGPVPGALDLDLKVDDHLPLHASQELNNQYTADTSKLRSTTALGYDNLFRRLDSVSLQYQASPQEPSEVQVWAASYTTRLGGSGAKVAMFAIDSKSDVASVGDGGTTVPVLGNGTIFGARYIQPVTASAASVQTFVGSVEYKDFRESVFAETFLQTPISYVNLSAGHVSAWRGDGYQWLLNSSANFGIRGLANDAQEFAVKRFHGRPNYFLLRVDTTWMQDLPLGLGLRWRVAGQYAVDPVISNEQFSAAGADGVRGYLEAEQLADVGFKTSFELGSPQWSLFGDRLQTGLFAFFDYAQLMRLDPLYEVVDQKTGERGTLLERSQVHLSSAGLGWTLAALDHFDASLTWAYPLVDRPSIAVSQGPEKGTRYGDPRLHFAIRAYW